MLDVSKKAEKSHAGWQDPAASRGSVSSPSIIPKAQRVDRDVGGAPATRSQELRDRRVRVVIWAARRQGLVSGADISQFEKTAINDGSSRIFQRSAPSAHWMADYRSAMPAPRLMASRRHAGRNAGGILASDKSPFGFPRQDRHRLWAMTACAIASPWSGRLGCG